MDFVTFEIATLLREKGYPQVSRETNYIGRKYSPDGKLTSAPYANGYACPTLSETLRWLRETHNIDITITVGLVTIDGTKASAYATILDCIRDGVTTIFDHHTAISLLTDKMQDGSKHVIGLLCLNKEDFWKPNYGLTVFNATNVVFATGGPGELYKISVWPHGQTGSHGIAFKAGAAGNNLTELQFGLASTKFRWNLSGTYQQVIPDYFSTDADGVSNKRHFLHDYFDDMPSMATNIFLKGYQWPFHAARLQNGGSSIIDIAVHREIAAGHRVVPGLAVRQHVLHQHRQLIVGDRAVGGVGRQVQVVQAQLPAVFHGKLAPDIAAVQVQEPGKARLYGQTSPHSALDVGV